MKKLLKFIKNIFKKNEVKNEVCQIVSSDEVTSEIQHFQKLEKVDEKPIDKKVTAKKVTDKKVIDKKVIDKKVTDKKTNTKKKNTKKVVRNPKNDDLI